MELHHHTADPDRPLTDAATVADALDLFVPFEARAGGALLVLLCDHEMRLLVPLLIEELDSMPDTGMPRMLEVLAGQMLGRLPLPEGVSALVAVARRGALQVSGTDRRWERNIRAAFRDRVPISGIHLITFDGSIPLSERRQAA